MTKPTQKEEQSTHAISKLIEHLEEMKTSFGARAMRLVGVDTAITLARQVEEEQKIDENTSDGYHTFGELYEHRIRLFIALCKALRNDPQYQTGQKADIWCSVLHSDGTKFEDWFILGIGKERGEQITYHLPARFWNEVCEFAQVLEKAPEYDSHTSDDVLKRLKNTL